MIRTGTAAWGPETAPGLIALEREKLDAAASHGLLGWLWLGDLTDLPPRPAPSHPVATASGCSPRSSTASRGTPALAALEGRRRAAEPRPR